VEDENISDSDALADKVEVNLSMFCALMLDEVGRRVDHADVVAIDKGGPR
jgi:hypothetical protein